MFSISYDIEGTPRPQGSKRHVGNGVMLESSKYVKEWRAFAKLKATIAMQRTPRIDKPHGVRLTVWFVFERPKKHFTSKGLRPDAPKFHLSQPDSDKLLRALLDSMSGVVFEDDSQVAVIGVEKVYGERAVTKVVVSGC